MNLKILPLLLIIFSISSAIELEMATPSFVDIATFFKISPEIMGWTLTANLIGFIIGSFFIGSFSEAYGRKKAMFTGNLILVIGALGCVYSPTISFLIFSRLLQGIGAACVVVLIPVIIADVYNQENSEKLYKIANGVLSAFTGIAPVFGGFINDSFGWRMNFIIVAVIEVISFSLLLAFFTETKKDNFKKFSITEILNGFKTVLPNKIFLTSITIPNVIWATYLCFITYAPFLYIEEKGISAQFYSIHLAVLIGFYSLVSLLAIKIKTTRNSLYTGCVLSIIGFTALSFSSTTYMMTLSICINSLGAAILMPSILAYSMLIFPDHKGPASSITILTRNLLTGLLVWVCGVLYNGSVLSLSIPFILLSIVSLFLTIYLIKSKNSNFLESIKSENNA